MAARANRICSALLVLRLPKLILSTALAAKPAQEVEGQQPGPCAQDRGQQPLMTSRHAAAHALMLDNHLWTSTRQCRHLTALKLPLYTALALSRA